jgi:hypothetical protein
MSKFTISIGGRGSEVCVHTIDSDQREKLEHLNLQECALQDVSGILEMDEMDLVSAEEIYVGAYSEHSLVTIEDEKGDIIFEEGIENLELQELLSENSTSRSIYQNQKLYVNDYIKGRFFELVVEDSKPFDIKKLELEYSDIEGLELITKFKYKGQESEIGDYWSKGITFFLSNE